ncbi:MAG TPA: EamA family transporter [Caulobacteraceae bacterium]|nr:EamA family transporter [Caulobacteraceae bacterium]
MTPIVIAVVLGAALLHASWNAILRGGADRLWSVTIMCAVSVIVALPFLVLLPPPARASWPCIGLSSALQVSYCLFLVRAYHHGGLAQVYPIARGTAPLLVTLGAAIVVGEKLTPAALAGVLLVSLGIMALAFERAKLVAAASVYALASGGFIAAYTVTDGLGARLAGNPQSYTVWLFVVQGLGMIAAYLAVRRRLVLPRNGEMAKAVIGGVLGLVSYGVVIWALARAPMGQVSALRETSILFAAVLGALFLKEKVTLPRAGAAAMIAAGAVVLAAG